MLPKFNTVKSAAAAAIAAVAVTATLAAPAQAFGDRERAFMQGVATAVIVDRLIDNGKDNARQQPRYYTEPQRPRYNDDRRYYDDGRYRQDNRRYEEPRRPQHSYGYGATSNSAARAFSEYTPATRRAIQRTLSDYGYYRGSIDGQWGPGTSRAIEAYARDEGRISLLGSRDGAIRLMNSILR